MMEMRRLFAEIIIVGCTLGLGIMIGYFWQAKKMDKIKDCIHSVGKTVPYLATFLCNGISYYILPVEKCEAKKFETSVRFTYMMDNYRLPRKKKELIVTSEGVQESG